MPVGRWNVANIIKAITNPLTVDFITRVFNTSPLYIIFYKLYMNATSEYLIYIFNFHIKSEIARKLD